VVTPAAGAWRASPVQTVAMSWPFVPDPGSTISSGPESPSGPRASQYSRGTPATSSVACSRLPASRLTPALCPAAQLTAFFTSSRILASAAAVSSVSA
jgi:hypothetical protein